ncbi:WcaF family extracellular polysaccharide biosynthesis acetyltransferase [Aeromonas enteropelogenes]|uniref:WcaF family extracellular polysaccharide biosynthesis acetyltransferase n=1 Tax=Aeromonas enteropelogenes TaxID=29489 RepID=UPI0039896A72
MIRLDQYSKGDYQHGPITRRIIWMIISICFFETAIPWPSKLKVFLLRLFGTNIGRHVVIKPNVKIKYPWKLYVGDFCWIGEFAWIDNLDMVNISDNVCISQGVYILTGNHDYKSPNFTLFTRPVIIECGCWVGAKSVLCPGTVMREGSVATVGSIVTCELESTGVYQGNPAVKKKMLRK